MSYLVALARRHVTRQVVDYVPRYVPYSFGFGIMSEKFFRFDLLENVTKSPIG